MFSFSHEKTKWLTRKLLITFYRPINGHEPFDIIMEKKRERIGTWENSIWGLVVQWLCMGCRAAHFPCGSSCLRLAFLGYALEGVKRWLMGVRDNSSFWKPSNRSNLESLDSLLRVRIHVSPFVINSKSVKHEVHQFY